MSENFGIGSPKPGSKPGLLDSVMFLLRFDILAILKNDFPGHGKLQRGPGGLLAHFMAEKDARCASVRHLTLNPQAWGLSLAAFMHPNERLAEICLTTSGMNSSCMLGRGVSIDPRGIPGGGAYESPLLFYYFWKKHFIKI